MPTDCIVEAYYLGSMADDAGKEGSNVIAVQITLTDVDDDGQIREEGASGPGDLINGEFIVTLKDDSALELDDGTVVAGWYIEFEDSPGDKQVYFVPTDGTVPQDGTLGEDVNQNGDQIGDLEDLEKVVPCFAAGTGIMTSRGEVAAIDVKPGDRVITRDNGMQTVRWVGHKTFSAKAIAVEPSLRPVRIPKDCFGPGVPVRDVFLSPQHQAVVVHQSTRLLFGEPEILAPATHLSFLPSIGQVLIPVTYVHLLFDRHELVLSEGLWTESFLPGKRALHGFGAAAQAEILTLFPELETLSANARFPLARPSLRRYETAMLLAGGL